MMINIQTTNENLIDQLNTAVSTTTLERCSVNLSYSRLSEVSVDKLISWLTLHPTVSVCVLNTGLEFNFVCRQLMTAKCSLDFIHSGRISFNAEPSGKALDKVHAKAFEEGRVLGLQEALVKRHQQIKEDLQSISAANQETAHNVAEMSKTGLTLQQEQQKERKSLSSDLTRINGSLQSLSKSVQGLNNHQLNITTSYEVLVTSLMKMYLQRKDNGSEVFELPCPQQKLDKVLPLFPEVVEWDGVLYVPSEKHLYLIEAKTVLNTSHIAGMQARMKRTTDFMELCKNKELPLPGASYYQKQLCTAWANLSEAFKVFGVVGAPGFSQEMLDSAQQTGVAAVFPNDGWYKVKMPSRMWSVGADDSKEGTTQSQSFQDMTISENDLLTAQQEEFDKENAVVE